MKIVAEDMAAVTLMVVLLIGVIGAIGLITPGNGHFSATWYRGAPEGTVALRQSLFKNVPNGTEVRIEYDGRFVVARRFGNTDTRTDVDMAEDVFAKLAPLSKGRIIVKVVPLDQ